MGKWWDGFVLTGCRRLCSVYAYDGAAEESHAELEREEGCLRLPVRRTKGTLHAGLLLESIRYN